MAICGRTAETAKKAADEIGHGTRGYACDIADADAVNATVKQIAEDLGPVAVLVNNAGVTRDGLMMTMKDDAWDEVIRTDLTGVFQCCRAVTRGMVKARFGRIITISSIVGIHGQAGQVNYASAKAGLIGMTKSIARELASRNITANVLAPGYISTDMTSGFTEDQEKAILGNIPQGRAGSPEDIAQAAVFLASEGAGYITGAVLPIDGGLGM